MLVYLYFVVGKSVLMVNQNFIVSYTLYICMINMG